MVTAVVTRTHRHGRSCARATVLTVALLASACGRVEDPEESAQPSDAPPTYSDPGDTGPGGSEELDLDEGRSRDPIAPGQRMRVTQRQWTEVFRDDFDTLDTSVWRVYDGTPGCCPDTRWDPAMVRVEDSSLFLDTGEVDGEWLSGGVGAWDGPLEQQFGRWDIRVRSDADALGVTVAALLWPADDQWPPEIDFYEIFETQPDRREMTVTNHYGEIQADGTHDATRRPVRDDFARWRVVSVRWTADEIQVVVDGRAVETIRDRSMIPTQPMWPALQTAAKKVQGEHPPLDGTRAMQVDWVRAYAPG